MRKKSESQRKIYCENFRDNINFFFDYSKKLYIQKNQDANIARLGGLEDIKAMAQLEISLIACHSFPT